MTRNILKTSVLIILGGLTAFNTMAANEASNKTVAAAPAAQVAPVSLAQLEEAVGYSAEEKSKVDALLRELNERRREVRDDAILPKKKQKAKIKEIDQEILGKIKAILSPEQFAKWEKLQEAKRASKRHK